MASNFESVSCVKFIERSRPSNFLGSEEYFNEEIKDTCFNLGKALIPFMHEEAISEVVAMLKRHHVVLCIETPRKKSLGICYFHLKKICINNNLNRERFLSVFIHEYAHLLTWLSFPKVAVHGIEFYYCYQELVLRFIEKKIIPGEMFLPILNRSGDYVFLKKYHQFTFELKTIRIGSKAIYNEEIIIRGKANCGKIHCIRMSDNAKILLELRTKVLPVLDLEF